MATARQRIATMSLMENGGSVGEAMRKAGYSPASVKNPDKLTKSEGFAELLNEMGIDQRNLADVLKGGLKARDKDGNDDWATRHRYLETGLKLHGLSQNAGLNINFNNYAGDQRANYELS